MSVSFLRKTACGISIDHLLSDQAFARTPSAQARVNNRKEVIAVGQILNGSHFLTQTRLLQGPSCTGRSYTGNSFHAT